VVFWEAIGWCGFGGRQVCRFDGPDTQTMYG
jgi:hypothetical protein